MVARSGRRESVGCSLQRKGGRHHPSRVHCVVTDQVNCPLHILDHVHGRALNPDLPVLDDGQRDFDRTAGNSNHDHSSSFLRQSDGLGDRGLTGDAVEDDVRPVRQGLANRLNELWACGIEGSGGTQFDRMSALAFPGDR